MAYGARRSGAARVVAVAAGIAAGVAVLPVTASAAHAVPGDREGPRHEVTYFYGSGPANLFDAYWHDSTQTRPGILILHGGYWVEGDKSMWQGAARWFADRGYAVFSANYRLAQDAPWPAQRTDALAAISYIKKHAAQFDLDPDRLAVLGSSAGGQIAADVGTYGSAAKRIRGVVALSPVVAPYQAYLDGASDDATKHRKRLRRTAAQLTGCRPGKASACWSSWYDVTPKNRVTSDDVPMLIAYSRDDLVSPTEGTGLRDALRKHGLGATLTVLPGSYHGGALLHIPGVHRRLLEFFDRVTRRREPTANAEKATVPSTAPTRTPSSTPSPTRSGSPTGTPTPSRPTTAPTPPTPTPPTPTIPGRVF